MAQVYVIATDKDNIVGDGVYDDTKGFQELLDIAKTSGAVEILVPPKTYRLTGSLFASANTTIICSEGTVFMKDHNHLLLTNNTESETYSGYAGNGNIKIIGGLWNCQAPERTGGTPFPFIHAEGLTFKDMRILDCNNGHAFELNACKHVLIDNCRFEGFYGNQKYEEAVQLDLAKGEGVAPWFSGNWDQTPCEYITVRDCYFGPSEKNGSWGRGIGSHSATIGKWHRNIKILNNDFDRTESWGIKTYSYERVTIDNNHFYRCAGGVSIDPVDPGDPKDTVDVNGDQTGASQDCTDIIVTKNEFYSGGSLGSAISCGGYDTGKLRNLILGNNTMNGSKAIYGNYLEIATVIGNTMHNVDTDSINISHSKHLTLSGNNLHGVNGSGMNLTTNNEHITVTGNTFQSLDKYGVWISNNGRIATVTGNVFSGCGVNNPDGNTQCIRITNDCDTITISGNVGENIEGTTAAGIWVSSTVKNPVVVGNNFEGMGLTLSPSGGTYSANRS